MIGDTLYKPPEKGFIPEIIPYPLEKISDEELARMGFEDVEDVADVAGVANLTDVANLEDVDSGRRNSMDLTSAEAVDIIGGDPYEKRTRSETAQAATAAQIAQIAPGARGTSSEQDTGSDVFTDLSTSKKPQND